MRPTMPNKLKKEKIYRNAAIKCRRLLSLLLAILLFTALPMGAADADVLATDDPSWTDVALSDAAEFDGYLVKFHDPISFVQSAGLSRSDPEQVTQDLYLVRALEEAEDLARIAQIDSIIPNYIIRGMEIPPADYAPVQWNTQAINAQAAWTKGLCGAGVKVAIIDSGVRTTHEDFVDVLPVVNVSDDTLTVDTVTSHGTAVAGVIAARAGNIQSPDTPAADGLAPGVTILPLRIFRQNNTSSVAFAIKAIRYAADQGCDVINMSFGLEYHHPDLQAACAYAAAKGALLVAAAGNDGHPTNYVYPASYSDVISVGAVEKTASGYQRAAFSRQNDRVFISAPGVGIISPGSGSDADYSSNDGTSFAAPAVAALAALVKEQNRAADKKTLETLLIAGSVDLGIEGRDSACGYGLIDVGLFVDEMTRSYTISFVNTDIDPIQYTLDQPPDSLPVPTRPHYLFDGWYTDAACTVRVDGIANGSAGDLTLYAKWLQAGKAEVESVWVLGCPAQPIEENVFMVTVPQNAVLAADSLAVIPSLSGAETGSVVWHEETSSFTFVVSFLPEFLESAYTVFVTRSAYRIPATTEPVVTGQAVPASLDGLTQAVAWEWDVSTLFSEPDDRPLQYTLKRSDCAAKESAQLSGESFLFTPDGEDAGKDVTFVFSASNGVFESSEVTLTVAVAQRPASQPVIKAANASFDRSHPADIDLPVTLYGNILVAVMVLRGEQEQTLSYTLLAHDTGFPDAVRLHVDELMNLLAGRHILRFTFESGAEQTLVLTVAEPVSAPSPAPSPSSPAEVIDIPAVEEVPLHNADDDGVLIEAHALSFVDVNADDWFYDAVTVVSNAGLMVGTSAQPPRFDPYGIMTRGMFVTVLHRLAGNPEGFARLSDEMGVKEGQYYSQAMAWALETGILLGDENGALHPEASITREQAAVIFLRYAQYKGDVYGIAESVLLRFADVKDVSDWALEGAVYCVTGGIITGKPGQLFDPKGTVTRAEFAAMLSRMAPRP